MCPWLPRAALAAAEAAELEAAAQRRTDALAALSTPPLFSDAGTPLLAGDCMCTRVLSVDALFASDAALLHISMTLHVLACCPYICLSVLLPSLSLPDRLYARSASVCCAAFAEWLVRLARTRQSVPLRLSVRLRALLADVRLRCDATIILVGRMLT